MSNVTALRRIPTTDDEWQDYVKPFVHSELVPEHFRGKPANCVIAAKVALRMGEDVLTTMQHMHVVKGKAGFATSYMIARANTSGLLKGRIRFRSEGEGNNLKVTAWARLADDPEEPIEQTVTWAMAQGEGWTKNPKYRTMPMHMLEWRAAAFLIRKYLPEVMLGFQTVEEITDVAAATVYEARAEQRPANPLALPEPAEEQPDAEAEVQHRQTREDVTAEVVAESGEQEHGEHPPDLPPNLDTGRGWAGEVEQESLAMQDDPSLF